MPIYWLQHATEHASSFHVVWKERRWEVKLRRNEPIPKRPTWKCWGDGRATPALNCFVSRLGHPCVWRSHRLSTPSYRAHQAFSHLVTYIVLHVEKLCVNTDQVEHTRSRSNRPGFTTLMLIQLLYMLIFSCTNIFYGWQGCQHFHTLFCFYSYIGTGYSICDRVCTASSGLRVV